MDSKSRILYLRKILIERTDEDNLLSTTQLINILNDEVAFYDIPKTGGSLWRKCYVS